MSDEDLRREQRRAEAFGEPSRRRLVELTRLASALDSVLGRVSKFRQISFDPIRRSPVTVGVALHIRKLIDEAPVLSETSRVARMYPRARP